MEDARSIHASRIFSTLKSRIFHVCTSRAQCLANILLQRDGLNVNKRSTLFIEWNRREAERRNEKGQYVRTSNRIVFLSFIIFLISGVSVDSIGQPWLSVEIINRNKSLDRTFRVLLSFLFFFSFFLSTIELDARNSRNIDIISPDRDSKAGEFEFAVLTYLINSSNRESGEMFTLVLIRGKSFWPLKKKEKKKGGSWIKVGQVIYAFTTFPRGTVPYLGGRFHFHQDF